MTTIKTPTTASDVASALSRTISDDAVDMLDTVLSQLTFIGAAQTSHPAHKAYVTMRAALRSIRANG